MFAFFVFRPWRKRNHAFSEFFRVELSKWILRVYRHFQRKHKGFEESIFSLKLFDIEWKTFGLFLETSTSPKEQFEGENFSKKIGTFINSPHWVRKIGLFLKFFWQDCHNCNVRLETNLFRNSFFLKIIFFS